jgi:hypothetical protein
VLDQRILGQPRACLLQRNIPLAFQLTRARLLHPHTSCFFLPPPQHPHTSGFFLPPPHPHRPPPRRRGQNSVSIRSPDPANWEKDLGSYCTGTDDYDIINLAFLHYFKDPASGKGPGGEPLPNLNFAYHCDSTFASLADPQFPTSGLLKVRARACVRAAYL